jgi:hypothetical protein
MTQRIKGYIILTFKGVDAVRHTCLPVLLYKTGCALKKYKPSQYFNKSLLPGASFVKLRDLEPSWLSIPATTTQSLKEKTTLLF